MSKYEVKLVNIGEEVDNRIRELEIELKDIRKRNDSLEFAKKHYKKHYLRLADENRIEQLANLTKEVNDLKKENIRLQARSDEKMNRLAFLEKLHSQHRYVFSEIPNTEENMKMVKLMKKHINPDRYNLRWRGQYLIDGEDWRKYTDGQPMNKSKCIRVYIDSKGDDTTEGFKESEVDVIKEGLALLVDLCEENIRSWDDGKPNDDVNTEKKTLETARQLLSYFTSMSIHLEESKLARAEVTNNVT